MARPPVTSAARDEMAASVDFKRFGRAGAWGTILAVVALVGGAGHAVVSSGDPFTPALSLAVSRGFTITSTVFETYHAGACSGHATARLFPGRARCLAVTVHNPQSFSLRVQSLAMTVASFSPGPLPQDPALPSCSTSMLSPPVLLASPFTVRGGTSMTIDKPISLSTEGNQDNCELGTFTFRFTGTATRAGSVSSGT